MNPDVEQRRAARVTADLFAAAIVCRIRPGHEVRVLDVSPCGALVETERRLTPGSRIDVQLETGDQREAVKARVVRCFVAAVSPHLVIFRSGLEFERELGAVPGWWTHEGLTVSTGCSYNPATREDT